MPADEHSTMCVIEKETIEICQCEDERISEPLSNDFDVEWCDCMDGCRMKEKGQ